MTHQSLTFQRHRDILNKESTTKNISGNDKSKVPDGCSRVSGRCFKPQEEGKNRHTSIFNPPNNVTGKKIPTFK